MIVSGRDFRPSTAGAGAAPGAAVHGQGVGGEWQPLCGGPSTARTELPARHGAAAPHCPAARSVAARGDIYLSRS